MTESDSNKRPPRPITLAEGTVVAGRFRVVDRIAALDPVVLHEGVDVTVGERRVVLATIPEGVDDAESQLLRVRSPWSATLLDFAPMRGGTAAVFELDDDAARIEDIGGVSREQRAALLADVAHVLEPCADEDGVRVVAPGLLWVEGMPHDPRVRGIPVVGQGSDAHAVDLATFARLIAQQLYGVPSITAPDAALAMLPPEIVGIVEPWYADDSATRLSRRPSGTELAAALGVSAGARRVPVMVAQPAPDMKRRVDAARTNVRRRFSRALALLMLILATLVAMSFGTPSARQRGGEERGAVDAVPSGNQERLAAAVEAAANGGQQLIAGQTADRPLWTEAATPVPVPTIATPPRNARQADRSGGMLFAALSPDHAVPLGLGRLDEAPTWLPYVVLFPGADGGIDRVESYAANGLLEQYLIVENDDEGRPEQIRFYSGVGELLQTNSYSWADGSVRVGERFASGAPAVVGCPLERWDVDGAAAAIVRRACLRASGEPAVYPEGHTAVRVTHEASESERRVTELNVDADGAVVATEAGVAGRTVVRGVDGRIAEIVTLDAAQEPVASPNTGAARVRFTRQLRTESTRLFDGDGAPTEGYEGWHQRDVHRDPNGALSAERTRDVDGAQVAVAGSAVAARVFHPDAHGTVAVTRLFDSNGTPVTDANGVGRIETVRDANDLVLRECHFGLDGPIGSAALEGPHCVTYARDPLGRVVRTAFYGVDGRPVQDSRTQVYAVALSYDTRGRAVERRLLDASGAPMTAWSGHAMVRTTYSDAGLPTRFDYLDVNGAPAQVETGVSSVTLEYDRSGHEVRRCLFDVNQEPTELRAGFGHGAACLSFARDARGRVSNVRYLGVNDELTLAEFGNLSAATIVFERDSAGALVRQRFLNTDGDELLTRDCRRPTSCIGDSGWSWHVIE